MEIIKLIPEQPIFLCKTPEVLSEASELAQTQIDLWFSSGQATADEKTIQLMQVNFGVSCSVAREMTEFSRKINKNSSDLATHDIPYYGLFKVLSKRNIDIHAVFEHKKKLIEGLKKSNMEEVYVASMNLYGELWQVKEEAHNQLASLLEFKVKGDFNMIALINSLAEPQLEEEPLDSTFFYTTAKGYYSTYYAGMILFNRNES